MVYTVFLEGGDVAPVQAQLMEEQLAERLGLLLNDLREALVACARVADEEAAAAGGDFGMGSVLRVVAEMIDECSDFQFQSLEDALKPTHPTVYRPSRSSGGDGVVASLAQAVQGSRAAERNASENGGLTDSPIGKLYYEDAKDKPEVPQSKRKGVLAEIRDLWRGVQFPRASSAAAVETASTTTNYEPDAAQELANASAKLADSMQALRNRVESFQTIGDESESLKGSIRLLEDRLKLVEEKSIENAKLGMETLVQNYAPKVLELSSEATPI
jgi:hypothetical protein